MQGIALCHNVTPVVEDGDDVSMTEMAVAVDDVAAEPVEITYQASSPDEVLKDYRCYN